MNENSLDYCKRKPERCLTNVKNREAEAADLRLAMFFADARYVHDDTLGILRIVCEMEADHDE